MVIAVAAAIEDISVVRMRQEISDGLAHIKGQSDKHVV
jgi:hypothetical protein